MSGLKELWVGWAKCEKCGIKIYREDSTNEYRIDEHHIHPRFMGNPNGDGMKIDLCKECHLKKLHPLILKIVQKYSVQLKKNNSEYWTWKYVLPIDREKCIDEVKQFTLGWLKE